MLKWNFLLVTLLLALGILYFGAVKARHSELNASDEAAVQYASISGAS